MHGTIERAKSKKRAATRLESLSQKDLDLIVENLAVRAREDFWSYRCLIHPTMKRGWFQRDVAFHLQQFYFDMIRGERPKLLLQSPPQHGKTTQIIDFLSWCAGKRPQMKQFYTAYGEGLGEKANRTLGRLMSSAIYRQIFDTRIPEESGFWRRQRFERNLSRIDYLFHRPDDDEIISEGYFRNTTINGQITGEGLDLGTVDDPIKGRSEAQSPVIRDKVWNWLTDDFLSRFADDAALLMTMTRWHLDDPAGRLIKIFPDLKVLQYKAIATEDEEHRAKGEALFPEHKSLEFLLERKKVYTKASWESLYQQNPIIAGGSMFPVDKVRIVPQLDKRMIAASVRYWDKAGTENAGAYSCGVLMHKLKRDCGLPFTHIISDVRRGQWSSLRREREIRQTAEMDNAVRFTSTWIEQEPGSGGKESAENTVRNLAGFKVSLDKVTGDKETRAEPYAAQVQGGNVAVLGAEWNRAFLDEHEVFPGGPYKDQVDAAAGSFNKLNLGSTYDSSYDWV